MQDEKTVEIVEAVKHLTDYEAGILELFISEMAHQTHILIAAQQPAKPKR